MQLKSKKDKYLNRQNWQDKISCYNKAKQKLNLQIRDYNFSIGKNKWKKNS